MRYTVFSNWLIQIVFTLCHTQHLSTFEDNLGNMKLDDQLIYFHDYQKIYKQIGDNIICNVQK